MASNDKQRFYPVRDADDPHKVSLVPVSEEIYHQLYPEIWRTQKRMKNLDQCICPKSKLWSCDGDCMVCEFAATGDFPPLDTPLADSDGLTLGDTIADDAPSPESIALYCLLLETLSRELEKLDPEDQRICELLMNHSERESADIMGMARSTFKRHWEKVRSKLYDSLKDFYF